MTLIHFTATRAEAICGPNRAEVARAAEKLGMAVTECDVDSGSGLVQEHRPQNVPAVAVAGVPGSIVVGAFPAVALVERLRRHLETDA